VQVVGDGTAVVINRGSNHGVEEDFVYLVYGISDTPIVDPETGESLGLLEYVRGRGRVVHVQEKMSTLRSLERSQGFQRTIKQRTPYHMPLLGGESVVETHPPEIEPFAGAKVGDLAKRLK
jgi:hypothetical protein